MTAAVLESTASVGKAYPMEVRAVRRQRFVVQILKLATPIVGLQAVVFGQIPFLVVRIGGVMSSLILTMMAIQTASLIKKLPRLTINGTFCSAPPTTTNPATF